MYPTLEKRTIKVFEILAGITADAESEMRKTEDLSIRKQVLAQWEKELTGYVRSEYRGILHAIDRSADHSQEEKAVMRVKIRKLTKRMVVARSVLEGLSEGGEPKPHQAGGAFPPPSNVDPALELEVEELLEDAIKELEGERRRSIPGELFSGFFERCNGPLQAALEVIEATLADSEAEYREFLARLRLRAAKALGHAILARGEPAADKTLNHVTSRLHHELLQHLQSFQADVDTSTVNAAAEMTRAWAWEKVRGAEKELALTSICVSLQKELDWFKEELEALIGEVNGRWDKPPVFQKVTREDLDSRVRQGSKDADGVYVEFYPDGHLKKAALVHKGRIGGTLKVWHGVAHARYEDSANVAEFHPNGTIDEYGGRYDREIRARITFRDWVVRQVRDMTKRL